MPNSYFQCQQFRVDQRESGMKVTTDACLFGAWVGSIIKEPKTILDIGAGTGLLALMLAQKTQNSRIDAVEMEQRASQEAHANFHKSPWRDRLTLYHQPIQAFTHQSRYEIIVTNPPFFEASQKGTDPAKNDAIHEATISQKELHQHVSRLLQPNGELFVLYPEREMTAFEDLISGTFHCSRKMIVRNSENGAVFRVMASFQAGPSNSDVSELAIRRPDNKYTDEFWALLKDYYLQYNDPASKK